MTYRAGWKFGQLKGMAMQECENCLAECDDRFCDICHEIESALDDDADMYAGAY